MRTPETDRGGRRGPGAAAPGKFLGSKFRRKMKEKEEKKR